LGVYVAVYEASDTQKPELKKLQRVHDAVLKNSSGG
jgi:hypothetical protein